MAEVSRARRLFLSVVAAAFLAASTYDIVRYEEHWPFSHYPMFAEVRRNDYFTWMRLYGVTPEGDELALDRNEFVLPYDQARLNGVLRKLTEPVQRPERTTQALRDFLNRYEERRLAQQHGGPPLVGMRIYQARWTLDPAAANVSTPDSRRLVAEMIP